MLFPANTDTLTILEGFDIKGAGASEAVLMSGPGVVRDCVVTSDSDDVGIRISGATTGGSIIERNEIIAVGTGVSVEAGSSGGIAVVSNLVRDCDDGVSLAVGSGHIVENNTIAAVSFASGSRGVVVGGEVGTSSASFVRNVVANVDTGFVWGTSPGSTSWTVDDNVYWDEGNGGTKSLPSVPDAQVEDDVDPLLCRGKGSSDQWTLRVDSPLSAGTVSLGTVLIGARDAGCAYGILAEDTSVSPLLDIVVPSDLVIPAGRKLTVYDSVSFVVSPSDYDTTGLDSLLTEILVSGEILALGKSGRTISFKSEAVSPAPGDWNGLMVPEGGKLFLQHGVIQHAVCAVQDSIGKPARSITLLDCLVSDFETAGVYLSPTNNVESSRGLFVMANCTVDMAGAPYGVFVEDDAASERSYDVEVDTLAVTGNSSGTYGVYLDTKGYLTGSPELEAAAEASLDMIIVSGLSNGTGVYVNKYSPFIRGPDIADCKWGIQTQSNDTVTVAPWAGARGGIDSCTTGLYAASSGSPDVDSLTIAGCTTGLYTDGTTTGSYRDVNIVGGHTGFKVKSTGSHTFRSGSITGFTHFGVDTHNTTVNVDLGNASDGGGSNIYSNVSGVLKFVRVKPQVALGASIPAQSNYWNGNPPDVTKFSTKVDYSNWATSAYSSASFSVPFKRAATQPVLRAFPNPFDSNVTIWYTVPGEGSQAVLIEVFDLQGRRLRHWKTETTSGGVVHWDGTSETGRRSAIGMYFVRLRVGTAETTVRLVRTGGGQ